MQSPTRAAVALTCFLLSGPLVHAQDDSPYQPRRARTFAGSVAQPLTSASAASPATLVSEFLASRGVLVPSASIIVVGDAVRAANDVRMFRLAQRVGGLTVYGVSAKAALSARGALVFLTENFVSSPPTTAGPTTAIDESRALSVALARLYPNERVAVGAVRREQNGAVFERTPFFHDSPRVTHVAVPLASGVMTRGLLVETWSEGNNLLHETLVSGTGEILDVVSRTSSDSYRVFVESPDDSDQTVISGPALGTSVPSPEGWLAGAQRTTSIAGNNARAYLDVDANNRVDSGGTAVITGEFLALADLTLQPSTVQNRAVAVQNLFFLNNVIHDELHGRGFNEVAGNFQENNFGRGGVGGDAVLAEAQDGGGLNNANFATPPDGRNPRMQMYLWSGPGPSFVVEVSGGAAYAAEPASFGPALTATGVTGLVLSVSDGGGVDPFDGCEAFNSDLTGRIALVRRGNCNFTVKVANAQAANAIAVIVSNNEGRNEAVPMGGTDRRIRIPSVMIGQADGAALERATPAMATLRANPNAPPQRDGSVDSDIVYHEYAHGLTWRMIGDMSGPLAGAIGEGASDSVAMLMNGDDVIAEYSSSSSAGIRRNPYNGYPRTYGDVTGESVHADGEIYAAVMWRLMELFGSRGLDRLKTRFVDGMNYTPPMPAYEDMRNGMLMSAVNSGSTLDCALIWDAFAQFGVGVAASGTASRSGTVTIVESFETSASCTP
jgi:hypothetical protein